MLLVAFANLNYKRTCYVMLLTGDVVEAGLVQVP